MENLLEIKNLYKHFPIPAGGVIRRRYKTCKAVDDISFAVPKGSCFGIAGESGSGKSTLAKLILLLEKSTGGQILYQGRDVSKMKSHADLLWYRQRLQTVFQDAGSSLSPRMRIKDIVSEPLEIHNQQGLSRNDMKDKVVQTLKQVGLGANILTRYPHELSGGQKQRVAIARAIILEPEMVILDEPVSALDVSVRAQILNLLMDIQEKNNLTYLIIAHDLAVLEHITTQIGVMYLGKIVEIGETQSVFTNTSHPYTRALLSAMPVADPRHKKDTASLSGEIGNPIDPPPGCRFHPRCPHASAGCRENAPQLCEITRGHQVACDLASISSGTNYLHT